MNTMTIHGPQNIHPDWLDHPLVTGAVRRSDGSSVSVVDELPAALNHLEEVCPGVPVRDILNTGMTGPREPARQAAADLLR